MNSFSKSLAPSIRISYMVLPTALMEKFQQKLGFYDCTVPSFEQYTLARFLSRGFFEKHINRMRRFYKKQRTWAIAQLKAWKYGDRLTICEQDAGLYFLMKLETDLSDRQLRAVFESRGLPFRCLADDDCGQNPENLHCLAVSYGDIQKESMEKALQALESIFENS